MTIESRLADMGLELPNPSRPVGNIVPCVEADGLVFLSGQGAIWNGQMRYAGVLGDVLDVEDGRKAAQICALNLLAQLKTFCGDLGQVEKFVKVTGMVRATREFSEIAQTVNGASDLFVDLFGDCGAHARSTMAVYNLPRGSTVVVEAVVKMKALWAVSTPVVSA